MQNQQNEYAHEYVRSGNIEKKAFIDQSFVYIIASLSALAVYMNSLKDDSIVSLALTWARDLLLDIGYAGVWTWGFETFQIESRWARWAILILILTFNVFVAIRLNHFIKQFDLRFFGTATPSADQTPQFTERLTMQQYEF